MFTDLRREQQNCRLALAIKSTNLLHLLLELCEVEVLADGAPAVLHLVELEEELEVALALVYRLQRWQVLQGLAKVRRKG